MRTRTRLAEYTSLACQNVAGERPDLEMLDPAADDKAVVMRAELSVENLER